MFPPGPTHANRSSSSYTCTAAPVVVVSVYPSFKLRYRRDIRRSSWGPSSTISLPQRLVVQYGKMARRGLGRFLLFFCLAVEEPKTDLSASRNPQESLKTKHTLDIRNVITYIRLAGFDSKVFVVRNKEDILFYVSFNCFRPFRSCFDRATVQNTQRHARKRYALRFFALKKGPFRTERASVD